MPPKDYRNRELFLEIANDNGKIRKLGRISEVPIIGYSVGQEKEYIDLRSGEISMELSGFSNTSDLFLSFFYGFDADKLKNNNWRKLHNLPMKRRIYHGCRKQNKI